MPATSFARYLAEKILYGQELTRAAHAMDEVEADNRAFAAEE